MKLQQKHLHVMSLSGCVWWKLRKCESGFDCASFLLNFAPFWKYSGLALSWKLSWAAHFRRVSYGTSALFLLYYKLLLFPADKNNFVVKSSCMMRTFEKVSTPSGASRWNQCPCCKKKQKTVVVIEWKTKCLRFHLSPLHLFTLN